MLNKKDMQAVYESVMSELRKVVETALNESDAKTSSSEATTYADDFVLVENCFGTEDMFMLASKKRKDNIDFAQVWIGQKIDAEEDEYDLYSFLFEPKSKKIAFIKSAAENVKSEKSKKSVEKKLAEMGIEDVTVRDIYVEKDDVMSAIKNIKKEEDEIKEGLAGIIWKEEVKETAPEKEEKKDDDVPDDEKLKKSKHITALLRKIAEDDDAFDGVVELFDKIEKLAKKHGDDYGYALNAINMRTELKRDDK